MQINFYATFRLAAGNKGTQLDLPHGSTVYELVRKLTDLYPSLHGHWLDKDNNIYPHVHIFINGEEVNTLPDGINTTIHPEDIIDFFPPVAGG